MQQRLKIEVCGIVQGVGFRPYVYRLARSMQLTGHIHNSDAGVCIEIQGPTPAVTAFLEALPTGAPPLARLLELRSSPIALATETEFVIQTSTHSASAQAMVSPDIATCADCLREMLDPHDRRYRYPFINCTNCGPRFTITRHVPYDRAQTSMAPFRMCAACQAEYDDPGDRRFHAQPNACPACGPQVSLIDQVGAQVPGDAVTTCIRLLQQGSILAIKGLGGFHLAVDATQRHAIEELRRRKHRGSKPCAVMVAGRDIAAQLCLLTSEDAAVLQSAQRPIVLLPKRTAGPYENTLQSIAPRGNRLGLFLPYTPLHALLTAPGGLPALVMTSGNLSEEPIAIDNAEALARLAGIADFLLLHNRDILLRCDDSVVDRISGRTQFARRSRGFVPSPIILAKPAPSVLAVGGELKNTICLSRGRYAYPGQHIGDLQNLSAYEFFEESIAHLQSMLEVEPRTIAHDLHPGYLSTQWAKGQRGPALIGVQHHHAHIASCMAEHQLSGPVIGVALDGTGYGTDGQAWGGEVLVATLAGFERRAQLAYVTMPGGEQAIHAPWRMAVAHLRQAYGDDWRLHVPPAWLERLPAPQLKLVEQVLTKENLSMLTSSCGRLFDAAASLVYNCHYASYEAEAAIILESICDPTDSGNAYPVRIHQASCLQIDAAPLFAALLRDIAHSESPAAMSNRFHRGVVTGFTEAVKHIAAATGLKQVCLSGGCFQNAILSQGLSSSLSASGFAVYQQNEVPPGDGGLSLGQLAVAASRTID